MNIWDTDYLFLFQIWTLQCQTARIKRLHDYYVVDIGRPVPLGLSPTMRMAFFYVEDDFDVYQSHKIFFSLQENNKLRQAENRMSVQWVNPDARPRLIEFCQHGLPVLLIRYVSQSPGHRNITTKLLCVYRTSLRVYHILFFFFFLLQWCHLFKTNVTWRSPGHGVWVMRKLLPLLQKHRKIRWSM